MAQNEPQRKERRQALHQTHHHYYSNISVEAANWRIESNRKNRFGSENRIESKLFLPESECSTVHNETTQPMKFGFQCMTLLLRHRIIHGNCMHGVHSLTNATHCVCRSHDV